MNQDDAFNRAIDQVARDLTAGAPRPGLAGRVRARIERPRRTGAWAWQVAGAIAALALMAYVAWPVSEMPRQEVVDRTVTERAAPSEPRTSAPPDTGQPRPSLDGTLRIHSVSARAPREPRVVPRIPIDREAPQLEAIREPSDLTLRPIEIAELTIAPLEPEKESR